MQKVSVIMPVYNAEKYLGECLDSVLGQTLEDIEVLCVDDGSTDGSAKILSDYAARDARVVVIRQANAGAGPARNVAMEKARGESVVFMDPDDYYPGNAVLAKLYGALMESGCDLAAGTVRRVPEDDPRAVKYNLGYPRTKAYPHVGVVTLDEYQSPFRYWCYIFRRAFLEANDLRFPNRMRFEDPLFMARVLITARKFYAIDECVYCYRLPEPGKSVDWISDGYVKLGDYISGFNELLDLAETHGCRKMYKAAADSFARAHRFDDFRPSHPLWKDVVAVLRRMRRRNWLSFGNFNNILTRMYGDAWGRGRLLLLIRLLGLRGGLSMWRYFRRTKRA